MNFEAYIQNKPALTVTHGNISSAFELLCNCYTSGGKLLVAGNGGSMCDSQHIVGELTKRFDRKRPLDDVYLEFLSKMGTDGQYLARHLEGALPAIALDSATLMSAVANDSGLSDMGFAQMVFALGCAGDVFWGISTSGNSRSVCLAAMTAKAKGMKVLGLTGQNGGKLKKYCDVCVAVPETKTHKIQELHLPVYHALCLMLEEHFFGD